MSGRSERGENERGDGGSWGGGVGVGWGVSEIGRKRCRNRDRGKGNEKMGGGKERDEVREVRQTDRQTNRD